MNAKDLNRAGHVSMGIAMVAAVVGALSLTSVPTAAFASSDDRSSDDSSSSSDDRGGSNSSNSSSNSSSDSNGGDSNDRSSDSNGGDSNDNSRDDNGGDTSGHGSDDVGYDDNGGNAGGNGSQNGVLLPVLNDVVADWETRGYRVLEIDREDGTVVEMKVITPEGKRVEMYVDAATNTILSQRLDN